ncbi:hypothetical protein C8Q76DRAFT_797553 [Earliella scabrosa]|nr:hypothetical protein C8Q76DRAFT_797553 [Earliella scabrosa]
MCSLRALRYDSALGILHYEITHSIISCLTLAPVVALKAEVAPPEYKEWLAGALFHNCPRLGSVKATRSKSSIQGSARDSARSDMNRAELGTRESSAGARPYRYQHFAEALREDLFSSGIETSEHDGSFGAMMASGIKAAREVIRIFETSQIVDGKIVA